MFLCVYIYIYIKGCIQITLGVTLSNITLLNIRIQLKKIEWKVTPSVI